MLCTHNKDEAQNSFSYQNLKMTSLQNIADFDQILGSPLQYSAFWKNGTSAKFFSAICANIIKMVCS